MKPNGPMTLAIVDDDDDVRRALSRLLRAMGHDVKVFASAEDFVLFFRTWYGPTLKAFAALEGDAREALEQDLLELARRSDRLGGGSGAIAIPAAYIEAVAVTR